MIFCGRVMNMKKKKTLSQKRMEDKVFYQNWVERSLIDAENPENTEIQKKYFMDVHRKALLALEVSKLDPIAAYRIFAGIEL